jgi:hypothetical protein
LVHEIESFVGLGRPPARTPKAIPFHTRPVTCRNGRVLISWPAPATPMILP